MAPHGAPVGPGEGWDNTKAIRRGVSVQSAKRWLRGTGEYGSVAGMPPGYI